MATFDLALAQLRSGTHDCLDVDHINQLARDCKHVFRDTILNPGNTFRLFVKQIAHGNVACAAVTHLSDKPFSDTAWCNARARLPMELIDRVHQQLVDDALADLNACDDVGDRSHRWRGHRLVVVDGSSDSMPDTQALREHYGVPSPARPGLGFPVSSLMLMMDHKTGLLLDCHDAHTDTHDAALVHKVHHCLKENDVVLGDDAFGSYMHLALLLRAKTHAIMPVHHGRIVDFTADRPHADRKKGGIKKQRADQGKPTSRWIKSLGENDQLVEYFKPPKKPDWLDQKQWEQIPGSITVREIRRQVKRKGFRPITVTIVTTLNDAGQYPADELIEIRLTRWMVETNLRHLKITLKMDILHCKTVDGIRKERKIFLLVYNLIRQLMLKAARVQRVNVNRLSFADTLAWLRLGDLNVLPKLKINPTRKPRLHPRVIKRPKKQFPYMTQPRAELVAQLHARHCDTA
jgi:hypothetical protein